MAHPILQNQRGNVIFILLIGVILLAALSFAVTQTQRGSVTQVTDENARLLATELIDYSNAVANAVGQLRLRGVAETALCFDSPQWPVAGAYNHAGCGEDTNKIFAPDGGGVVWNKPSALAFDASGGGTGLWEFVTGNEVAGVGTSGLADENVDLLMVASGLTLKVCRQINQLVNVQNPDLTSTPSAGGFANTPFTGSFTGNTAIDDTAGTNKLYGKKSGCFSSLSGGGQYVFYRVLLAR